MNNKYIMINGFAFSEESDMEKLKNYAKKGWILEDIVAGFFYKLKKDKPKDIQYCLDYQDEATKEYFSLFLESGWTPVVSLGSQIHIFSAPVGTKPIYTESESEIDKYSKVEKQSIKGSIYALIAIFSFVTLLVISAIYIKPIVLIVFLFFIISIVAFVFNFMPYLAYNYRLKQLRGNNKYQKDTIFNTRLWIYRYLLLINGFNGFC